MQSKPIQNQIKNNAINQIIKEMKRLLTFFLFSVLVLSVSAQDNYIWFPEETVNLEGSTKEYTQEIWYEGALPGGGIIMELCHFGRHIGMIMNMLPR